MNLLQLRRKAREFSINDFEKMSKEELEESVLAAEAGIKIGDVTPEEYFEDEDTEISENEKEFNKNKCPKKGTMAYEIFKMIKENPDIKEIDIVRELKCYQSSVRQVIKKYFK